jgi:hypothetical protein
VLHKAKKLAGLVLLSVRIDEVLFVMDVGEVAYMEVVTVGHQISNGVKSKFEEA